MGGSVGVAPGSKLPWERLQRLMHRLALLGPLSGRGPPPLCAGRPRNSSPLPPPAPSHTHRLLWAFSATGYLEGFQQPARMLPYVAATCGVATLVESLPINQWLDDNLSVPLVAAAMSAVLLPACALAVGTVAAPGVVQQVAQLVQ